MLLIGLIGSPKIYESRGYNMTTDPPLKVSPEVCGTAVSSSAMM